VSALGWLAADDGAERAQFETAQAEARDRAEQAAQAYRQEHGMWPGDHARHLLAIQEREEAAARSAADQEGAERHSRYLQGLLTAGHRPRSLHEILQVAEWAS
jgi:hypothetical protein